MNFMATIWNDFEILWTYGCQQQGCFQQWHCLGLIWQNDRLTCADVFGIDLEPFFCVFSSVGFADSWLRLGGPNLTIFPDRRIWFWILLIGTAELRLWWFRTMQVCPSTTCASQMAKRPKRPKRPKRLHGFIIDIWGCRMDDSPRFEICRSCLKSLTQVASTTVVWVQSMSRCLLRGGWTVLRNLDIWSTNLEATHHHFLVGKTW